MGAPTRRQAFPGHLSGRAPGLTRGARRESRAATFSGGLSIEPGPVTSAGSKQSPDPLLLRAPSRARTRYFCGLQAEPGPVILRTPSRARTCYSAGSKQSPDLLFCGLQAEPAPVILRAPSRARTRMRKKCDIRSALMVAALRRSVLFSTRTEQLSVKDAAGHPTPCVADSTWRSRP